MSQSEIEAIKAHYEAISRQDWAAVFRDAHPDFDFRPPARGLIDAGPVRGPDGARKAMADFFSPYEEVTIEPVEFHERGDRIVVYFLLRTRPHGSSKTVELQAGHLWTMRDGRAAGLEIFPEREKALEAAEREGARVD